MCPKIGIGHIIDGRRKASKQPDHSKPYLIFDIPKKHGRFRRIYAPSPKFKRYLQGILQRLYRFYHDYLVMHDIHCYGFVKNRNIVQMAAKHINFQYTIRIDIKDFFDNTTIDKVSKYFENNKNFTDVQFSKIKKRSIFKDAQINRKNKYQFDKLLFIDGRTPQGFPTSPFLSCLAMIDADKEINSYLYKLFKADFAFTRYADDIIISYNQKLVKKDSLQSDCSSHGIPPKMGGMIISGVKLILLRHGYEINTSKIKKFNSSYGRKPILGLSISDKVYIPRRVKRRIRALHHLLYEKDFDLDRSYIYDVTFLRENDVKHRFKWLSDWLDSGLTKNIALINYLFKSPANVNNKLNFLKKSCYKGIIGRHMYQLREQILNLRHRYFEYCGLLSMKKEVEKYYPII